MDVKSYYNLPDEVRFCRSCAITNQRPRLKFDQGGSCSVCRYHTRKHREINWDARAGELRELCDTYRRTDGRFDVVVPFSGGKDSCTVAHKLKYKYGMNPLTVTFAPHIYTEVGLQNIQSAIRSGLYNLTASADGRVHRQMTRLAFEHMGDPFLPFVYGQQAFPFQIAVHYDIPLVMYGEDGNVEYEGMEEHENRSGYEATEESVKKFLSGFPLSYWKNFGLSDVDLAPYQMPSLEQIKNASVVAKFFSYYEKWMPQQNYYYAAENCGFKANPDGRSEGTYSKYASLDDKIDGFHYYLAFIKFGLGRAMGDAAHEVRDGHITREEAVLLIHKYNGEFPRKHFKDFLEYVDLDEEAFWQIVDRFRPSHLWEKVSGEWKLKEACH